MGSDPSRSVTVMSSLIGANNWVTEADPFCVTDYFRNSHSAITAAIRERGDGGRSTASGCPARSSSTLALALGDLRISNVWLRQFRGMFSP